MTTTRGMARRSERRNLLRHFFAMVVAMLVGMAVLGAVAQGICPVSGHSGFFVHHVAWQALLIAVDMAISMAVWMRRRGHGWAPITEMSATMLVPLGVLIGPFWAGGSRATRCSRRCTS